MKKGETFSITFGGQVENHVGMEMIGQRKPNGFTTSELESAAEKFSEKGFSAHVIKLDSHFPDTCAWKGDLDASILIVKNGISALLPADLTLADLSKELSNIEWDSKAFMYGRVVNKHARENICIATFDQEPEYEKGKGKVVSFDNLPCLKAIRETLVSFLGDKAKDLLAEGNRYKDVTKCGISFHGDTERKIVVALRVGAQIPLDYQWFYEGEPVGARLRFNLDGGDLYVMSEKTTGFDWKKRKVPTLRHAAGAKKYLEIKKRKKPEKTEKTQENKKVKT